MSTTAPVIALDHPAALDAARVGRKAADLAAARAAGLPAVAGVVLTTDWATSDVATAAQVWRITSHDGARPLVVRSSASDGDAERGGPGNGAVRPARVAGDLAAMLAAVDVVRAADAAAPVLLQPHVPAEWHGALFADDAAAGWDARLLVVARASAGDADWVGELDHAGRVRAAHSPRHVAAPPADVLARAVRLSGKVAAAFAGRHDLEWIADAGGRVQLLRVRPVVRAEGMPWRVVGAGPGQFLTAA